MIVRRGLVLAGMLAFAWVLPGQTATPGKTGESTGGGHVKPLPPIAAKAQGDRIKAADMVARGQSRADASGIVTLRNGKRVRYRLQGTEYLTVALIDFADLKHGNLPAVNPAVDNSTYRPDSVDPAHYRDMLFTAGGGSYGRPSMRDYYLQQSSGRFTWTGQVSNWVPIAGTAATYGANSRTGGDGSDDANGPVYRVVDATLQGLAANGYAGLNLAAADQIDRYDCDGDGIYNEPDGYVDHFAIVHAGQGEEEGAGANTIWSHRWYANYNTTDGPSACKLGGYRLPGTDLWVGDYTIEPENGGVGVFAHEFGHDLGLPDLYDTVAGNNGTAFWTLMSSGSWASDSKNAIGDKPVHMGGWEKLVLGWIGDNLATAQLGQDASFELGPAETATRGRAQALRVNLPDYQKTFTVFPPDGADVYYLYSTRGNDLDTWAKKGLTASGAATPIRFRAMWDIETGWDYAYLVAQVNGAWQTVPTTASTNTNPNGQNFGNGITGSVRRWTTVEATLPAGATAYGFRYWTDGAVAGTGFAVDSVEVQGGVENFTTTTGWDLASGFVQAADGTSTETFFHYYLMESRSYIDNDSSLCGAYNFLAYNLVEKQCYADGLLLWYRNGAYSDNDTSVHPGYGMVLPVDAHPTPMLKPDGKYLWGTTWQSWDATFGLAPHSITLSQYLNNGRLAKQTYDAPAVSNFYDDPSGPVYWNAARPQNSVKTPGSRLRIDVIGISPDAGSYRVRVHQ